MPRKIPQSNNHTTRIGHLFEKELQEIKDARIESGLDKTKQSTRRLTNLITTHKLWPIIKRETIEVSLEGRGDEDEE